MANEKEAFTLRYRPSLVIFWDLGRLLMELVEGDENQPPHEAPDAIRQKEEIRLRRRFGSRPFLDG